MGHITRVHTLPYILPYYSACQELSYIISTSHPFFSADTATRPKINTLLQAVILPARGQIIDVLPSEGSYRKTDVPRTYEPTPMFPRWG